MRTKIVAHEHVHLLQQGLSLRRGWPEAWLLEGSAEFIGFFVIATAGLYDLSSAGLE